MKSLFTNIVFLFLVAIITSTYSLYVDWGTTSWVWFQRSGSILILAGAIMGFRSVLRLGVAGVGGANTLITTGKGVSVDSSGPVQKLSIAYDEETQEYLFQAALDKLAGYIGAFFVVMGTFVAGYGDLLGRL